MEYRRNWDKLSYRESNLWIHQFVDLTAYPVVEPVTLDEMKTYLKLDGYAGVSSVEDALLESFISEARARLEAASGADLVAHTYKVSFTSYNSTYRLPFVVDSITTFTDSDEVDYTGYTFENGVIGATGDFIVTYDTIPLPTVKTKISVLRLAAYMYQNRGDGLDESKISQKAHDLSGHYTAKSWLL